MNQEHYDKQDDSGDFNGRWSFKNRVGASRIGKNRFGNHSVGDIERNTLPEEAFEVHSDPSSGAPQAYASILNMADQIQESIDSGKAATAHAAQNTPQTQWLVNHLLAVAHKEDGEEAAEYAPSQENTSRLNFSELQAAFSHDGGRRFGTVAAAGTARDLGPYTDEEVEDESGEGQDDLPLDVEDDGGTITDEILRAEEAALEQLRAEIRGQQAARQQAAPTPPTTVGVPLPPGYAKKSTVSKAPGGRLCLHCDTVNSQAHKFCVECGADIRPKACFNCGTSFAGQEKFCGECGTRRA